MLAYASHRRQRRRLSPASLALIIGGHAVAIALVITARMELAPPPEVVRTIIQHVPLPEDPPPPPPKPIEQTPSPAVSGIDVTPRQVEVPLPSGPVAIPLPPQPNPGPVIGTSVDPVPVPIPIPPPQPLPPPAKTVKAGPVLATSGDRLKPPYPDSKRRLEEEAVLRLRLGIDERGRVTSVDPVGAADPDFLASARSHLVRHWRYRPATEDGRPVATSIIVTLRFELEA